MSRSWAEPTVTPRLSAPVASLPLDQQERFRDALITLPSDIDTLHMRDLAWSMAQIQERHREAGRPLSAAMAEALAAAHVLGAAIAVSALDVGPHLRSAAAADQIDFLML